MLNAMQSQRDSALNAHVVLQAEMAALKRTLAERESTIKRLSEEIKTLRSSADALSNLPSNPYAQEGATVQ